MFVWTFFETVKAISDFGILIDETFPVFLMVTVKNFRLVFKVITNYDLNYVILW